MVFAQLHGSAKAVLILTLLTFANLSSALPSNLDPRTSQLGCTAPFSCRDPNVPCNIKVSPADCILCECVGLNDKGQTETMMDWNCLGVQLGLNVPLGC